MRITDNKAEPGTGFTVSVEASHGVTAGISARDRVTTIATAVADHALFWRPGRGRRRSRAW